jgi:hypothetical protein
MGNIRNYYAEIDEIKHHISDCTYYVFEKFISEGIPLLLDNALKTVDAQVDFGFRFEEIRDSMIGTIEFGINKSNFDNYKRNYQKLQSLLAEIMSVINLFFEVGRQISNIFGGKKMSLSIIEYLLNKDTLHLKKSSNKIVLIKNKNNESSPRKEKSELPQFSLYLSINFEKNIV